jgi:hypothetical protein
LKKNQSLEKNPLVFGKKSVSGIKSLDFSINSLAFRKIPCLLKKKSLGLLSQNITKTSQNIIKTKYDGLPTGNKPKY